MNQRYKALWSAVFAVSVLAGCSSSEKRPVAESEAKTADTTETEKTDTAKTEEPASTTSGKASIDETVLLDHDGVTVTAKELKTDSIWGSEIQVEIENNSDKDVGIGVTSLVVNDYMVFPFFSAQVTSGNKAIETITLMSDSLQKAGVDDIGEIAIQMHLFDPETYMTEYVTEEVVVKTSHSDQIQPVKMDDGVELVNQDGIRIVGKYLDEDSIWGNAIVLFLENESDKNVIVQCDDMSVNGYMMTPLFSCDINAGRMAIDEITLLSSDLEKAGIETVTDVEMKFIVLNPDTFETLFTTDTITFSITE